MIVGHFGVIRPVIVCAAGAVVGRSRILLGSSSFFNVGGKASAKSAFRGGAPESAGDASCIVIDHADVRAFVGSVRSHDVRKQFSAD